MADFASTNSLGRTRGVFVINVRNMYSTVIALIPVIMILNVPILNIGASTVLLGLFAPYALLRYKSGRKTISLFPFVVLIGYLICRAAGSLINQVLLVIVLIHVFGAVNDSLNIRVMRKTIENVAMLATVCVILQTLIYYVLGIRTMFLIEALVLEENRNVFSESVMGGSLYRPSAFFLEPSHYTQYCCLGLLSVLFPMDGQKANLKKAVWIALGCLLTTSGMGIALCIGVFGWYVLFTRRGQRAKLKSLIGWALAAVIAYFVLIQFSFFSLALQRIFGEVDGYNAIWGRTLFWDAYIGGLEGSEVLFGRGIINLPEGYMTGLMEVIYCYGYAGAGLMLLVFVYLFIRSKDNMARCICVIYCCLMCIGNLLGFLVLSFWLCLTIASANARSDEYACR